MFTVKGLRQENDEGENPENVINNLHKAPNIVTTTSMYM